MSVQITMPQIDELKSMNNVDQTLESTNNQHTQRLKDTILAYKSVTLPRDETKTCNNYNSNCLKCSEKDVIIAYLETQIKKIQVK